MSDYEICCNLQALDEYLLGCEKNAAPGGNKRKVFELWRKAVNAAWEIVHERAKEEDDGE